MAKIRKVKQDPRSVLNRLIRQGMARLDITTQAELADLMGMQRMAVSRRMNGIIDWDWEELCRLFKLLQFTPEEAARAMAVSVEGSSVA